jgi:hypothetical protein
MFYLKFIMSYRGKNLSLYFQCLVLVVMSLVKLDISTSCFKAKRYNNHNFSPFDGT